MGYHDGLELQPLKITAHLRTGVVADRWLPLDGILLYYANYIALGSQDATLPGGGDVQAVSTLPLAEVHPGRRNWYYACSWAYPQPWWIAEGCDHWNKRIDTARAANLVDFGNRRGKIQIGEGRYKAYHMPIFYYAALSVSWYCMGDADRIHEILSMVTHIGKKTAQGWGRVIRWDVEPWHSDWSVHGPNGQLMRGVPFDDAGDTPHNLLHYGMRPPYYKPSNQMMLVMPDAVETVAAAV